MKLKEILTETCEPAKHFGSAFFNKHRSVEDCTFCHVETEKLAGYFNESHPVTYILGETHDAPTGEKYKKICVEGDTPEETEGALLFLLQEYRRLSIKSGKNYLFWRVAPYLKYYPIRGKDTWQGRTRLLYTNKLPTFLLEQVLKDGGKAPKREQWKCTYRAKTGMSYDQKRSK